MKIAVDIDEVLFEFVRGYLEFAKLNGFKEVDFKDMNSYKFHLPLEISDKMAVELAQKFHDSEYFEKCDLVEGAVDFINSISHCDLFFITSRPVEWRDKTIDFLKSNFGIDESKVFFAGDFHKHQGKTKEQICEYFGIGIIIDDRGDYGLNYANCGIRVLMPDKPWNQGFSHDLIYRCRSWSEISEKIKEFENGN